MFANTLDTQPHVEPGGPPNPKYSLEPCPASHTRITVRKGRNCVLEKSQIPLRTYMSDSILFMKSPQLCSLTTMTEPLKGRCTPASGPTCLSNIGPGRGKSATFVAQPWP